MSSLHLRIPHQLSQEEALSRVKGLLTNLQEEQKDKIKNVNENWQEHGGTFSFTMQGFDLAGKIGVEPDAVTINADLPFALSFFKGKIASVIEEEAASLLA